MLNHQITVKEALHLTRKTMRLGPHMYDSDEFSDDDSELENYIPGKVAAQLQKHDPHRPLEEAFSLSKLDPQTVRRTIRQHFSIARAKKHLGHIDPTKIRQDPPQQVADDDVEFGINQGAISESPEDKTSNFQHEVKVEILSC